MLSYVAFYATLIVFWTFPTVLNGIGLITQLSRKRRWTRLSVIQAVNICLSTLVAAEFVWLFVRYVPSASTPLPGIGWFLLVLFLMGYGVYIVCLVRFQLVLYRPLAQVAAPPLTHDRRQRRGASALRRQRLARLQRARQNFDAMGDIDG